MKKGKSGVSLTDLHTKSTAKNPMSATANQLHATVTAYKGHLVMELLAKTSIENEVSTTRDNPSVCGQLIMNTARHLGVSDEALELLGRVRRGPDQVGHLDWIRSTHGDCFSWQGGPYNIVDPKAANGSCDFAVLDSFVRIQNRPAEGAKQAVESTFALECAGAV